MRKFESIIVYGGSFNPLHIGHMRLAIEALALFRKDVSALAFMPSYHPPHKESASLLPFEMRARMIEEAIAAENAFVCCEVEKDFSRPSYTYDVLKKLLQLYELKEIYFLLGSQDFMLLPEWKNGLRLPEICNLIVAPRGNFRKDAFMQQCRAFWPGGIENREPSSRSYHWHVACYHPEKLKSVFWISTPYLEISSSEIRSLWLKNIDIRYLVPDKVLAALNNNRRSILEIWQEKKNRC